MNGGLAWPDFWDISLDRVPIGRERESQLASSNSDDLVQSSRLVWFC